MGIGPVGQRDLLVLRLSMMKMMITVIMMVMMMMMIMALVMMIVAGGGSDNLKARYIFYICTAASFECSLSSKSLFKTVQSIP